MLVFISGGVRSGKSSYGETLAAELAGARKIYMATSEPYDDEMRDRIKHHKEQRKGKGFFTIEKSRGIGELTNELEDTDTVLLDCLGNLLANEMFSADDSNPANSIFRDISSINNKISNLIIISNDVFSDGCLYSDSVVRYIDELAELHKMIVRISDRAIECSYGNRILHKCVD